MDLGILRCIGPSSVEDPLPLYQGHVLLSLMALVVRKQPAMALAPLLCRIDLGRSDLTKQAAAVLGQRRVQDRVAEPLAPRLLETWLALKRLQGLFLALSLEPLQYQGRSERLTSLLVYSSLPVGFQRLEVEMERLESLVGEVLEVEKG